MIIRLSLNIASLSDILEPASTDFIDCKWRTFSSIMSISIASAWPFKTISSPSSESLSEMRMHNVATSYFKLFLTSSSKKSRSRHHLLLLSLIKSLSLFSICFNFLLFLINYTCNEFIPESSTDTVDEFIRFSFGFKILKPYDFR